MMKTNKTTHPINRNILNKQWKLKNGYFTADCFRLSFVIRKGWDIETEWRRTQETQDWRENLQLWKGETHFKEVDYQIQQD